MMLRFILPVLLSLTLSSCASLSKEECLAGNWNDIGFNDGRNGYRTSYLNKHKKACAEYGVKADREAYLQGHKKGLLTYCTPSNARRVGERGSSYQGVCPADKESDFLRHYEYGRDIHDAKQKINNVSDDIRNKEEQLHIEKNASIRNTLRNEIRALDDLMHTLRHRLNDLLDNPPR